MSGHYAADLSYIHHVGFGDLARNAAPAIVMALREAGIRSGRIVDLGCGSGILASALLRAGYDVLGIDQSSAMIALARRTAPRAEFRRASCRGFKIPPCSAVTSTGECLNYLVDRESRRSASLDRFFRSAFSALAPGGLLIFDVAAPGRGAGHPIRFRSGRDWAVIADVREDARRRRLVRTITLFRKVGRLWRRSHEVHHVRLRRPAQIAAVLRRVGFGVAVRNAYGKYVPGPGLAVFVARKPPMR